MEIPMTPKRVFPESKRTKYKRRLKVCSEQKWKEKPQWQRGVKKKNKKVKMAIEDSKLEESVQNLESGLYNLRVQMKTMISLWLIKIIKTACLKSMWLSNIIKTVISWWILQKNKFIMSIKNHQSSRINKITNILKRTLLLSRHQHIHSWGYSGLLVYWTSLIMRPEFRFMCSRIIYS